MDRQSWSDSLNVSAVSRVSVSHIPAREFGAIASDSYTPHTAHSFLQPKKFVVPRGVVRRAMQVIDQAESPDSPGEVRIGALMAALQRFYKTFGTELHSDRVMEIVKQLGVQEDLGRSDFKEQPVAWSSECVFDAFCVVLGPLERLYFTLDMAENSNYASQLVSLIVFTAVMLSLVTWQLGTVESISEVFCEGTAVNECMPQPPRWMQTLEDICVWIFTAEILLRLVSVGSARRNLLNQFFLVALISGDVEVSEIQQTSIQRFCSFILSPSCIFDVLSVVPYWGEMAFSDDHNRKEINVLRMLYLARVTRVFKLTRALNADLGQLNEVHDLFRKVLIRASPAILMTVLLIATALFFFGTLIWYAERGDWVGRDDPRYILLTSNQTRSHGAWLRKSKDGITDELSPFNSIPGAFWWTIVTITTVGYGDQVPVTYQGKLVGAFAMLYGTVILGLPLFVVGATFGQEYDRLMKESKRRQEQLKGREGLAGGRDTGVDKTREQKQAIKNILDEQAAFANALEEYGPAINITPDMGARWLEGVRAAQLDSLPSVAIDRLGVRVLSVVAEAEELVLPGGTALYWPGMETNVKLGPEELERQMSCRKIRLAWHKFALATTQLPHIPHGMLIKALTDPGDENNYNVRKSCSNRQAMFMQAANRSGNVNNSSRHSPRSSPRHDQPPVKRYASDSGPEFRLPSTRKRGSEAAQSICSDPTHLQASIASSGMSSCASDTSLSDKVMPQADDEASVSAHTPSILIHGDIANEDGRHTQGVPHEAASSASGLQPSTLQEAIPDSGAVGLAQCCVCTQEPATPVVVTALSASDRNQDRTK